MVGVMKAVLHPLLPVQVCGYPVALL